MRRDTWRQLWRLSSTLRTIARLIREECSTAAADEHLWAFRGFHLEPSDPHYRARQWRPVSLSRVSPDDVVGMPVGELAFMMQVAMEIEDPIMDYSHQNGEGFRVLLPALGRFMGRNDAEAAYARAHGLPWCESPWCAEERRHGNAFAKAVERLTGMAPPRDNPNVPRVVTADESEALRHLVSRQAAEWASASTYVVMAAHASGALHELLRNLARDEIKHLCLLAAADRYLLGPRPWRRLTALVRIGLENYRGQKRSRSSGQQIGSNWVTALEVVCAHLAMESRVRTWLATVPLMALTLVFETDPALAEHSRDALPRDEQDRVAVATAEGRRRRLDLARWRPRPRARAMNARRVLETDDERLTATIARDFGGFAGGEDAMSPVGRAIQRRIMRVYPARLRLALLARLRTWQIQHNRHVRARASGRGTGQDLVETSTVTVRG